VITAKPLSGLLGLSFGNINTVTPKPVNTPVDNMILQNDLPANMELFTCYLGSVKDVNDPDKGESFFTFGSIDQDVIKASGQQIHYTPVDNSNGFWMFNSTTATVNGKTINLSGNRAIADTGTTLCLVSDKLCEAIYSQIKDAKLDNQQGGYTFPASVPIDELPQVTLDIGGKQFNVERENLAFAPVDESGATVFGGIQPRGDLKFDIFGDAWLMGVYAASLHCIRTPDGC
jgi:Eukaryotic aspartyl protease